MSDIITERSGSILRVQFNRPAKKNAMTLSRACSMTPRRMIAYGSCYGTVREIRSARATMLRIS